MGIVLFVSNSDDALRSKRHAVQKPCSRNSNFLQKFAPKRVCQRGLRAMRLKNLARETVSLRYHFAFIRESPARAPRRSHILYTFHKLCAACRRQRHIAVQKPCSRNSHFPQKFAPKRVQQRGCRARAHILCIFHKLCAACRWQRHIAVQIPCSRNSKSPLSLRSQTRSPARAPR